ncbi:AMP-binding protein [Streptomyces radicis]|uniref:D-alanine--poly(Phosphoribitol) ligase n=1 Tax=Streptomyces radicis TaxID=1750517 RepID=A0A3A9W2W2_9ACTN|nr:AMP-binding protein [Streptomyces radicis]RKN07595.1 D-alanine--poly(phosphoribitol) ligase [Streptomyces radicis]RKN18318.1 D-alanine--poly(phosphoribitol) ligase [Streptomyces radicis]
MKTLHSWFTDSVRRVPDQDALVVAGQRLSYAQLDAVSRKVAALVAAAAGTRPVRVGLLAAGSVVAYAGYLGVLRGGGTVVPLSEDYPADRNRQILELARLDVVLADEGRDTSFADGTGVPVIAVAEDDVRGALRAAPAVPGAPLDDALSADAVAYILFTSGSTGVPKGVPIRHRNLDAFLRFHLDRYQVGPGCRMSQTFGLTFDPSVFDMFVAWGGGATLVVPSRGELVDPVGFVNDHALTHWYSVPSIVSLVRDSGSLDPGSLPTLRHSLFAGEQLTLEQARVWSEAAPGSTVENLYGPTELSVTVTAYRLPADRSAWPKSSNGTVPIGRVYPHLDQRIDPDTGELQVRGPQRFDGYLDPADNDGRFHEPGPDQGPDPGPDPGSGPGARAWYRTGDRVAVEDGELVHIGRLDQQVKIMGRRLELGDVESAIRRWGGLDHVVVVAAPGPGGEPRLTAVYSGIVTAPADLRDRLRPHLPVHMLPDRFVQLDALPLNANGKVDRQACGGL